MCFNVLILKEVKSKEKLYFIEYASKQNLFLFHFMIRTH